MKTERLYRELEKNLPAGFTMNFSCTEYLSNDNIYYPSADKLIEFRNGYYRNFLKLFFEDEDAGYRLYDKKGIKSLCKSNEFHIILAVIGGIV